MLFVWSMLFKRPGIGAFFYVDIFITMMIAAIAAPMGIPTLSHFFLIFL